MATYKLERLVERNMHLYRNGVFDGQQQSERGKRQGKTREQAPARWRAITASLLIALCSAPSGFAQTPAGTTGPDKAASDLPSAPAPAASEPFSLRTTARDFSKPFTAIRSIFSAPHRLARRALPIQCA